MWSDARSLREHIERRLAAFRPRTDPQARLLSSVTGPVSAAMREWLTRPWTDAAVLIGLVERPTGLSVLFTQRASHLKAHPGQISFPGGRLAVGETPIEAALREAREEVGVSPEQVAVAGCLDVYLTVTGFAVTPVVGFIDDSFRPRPDPAEVAAVFEVPFEFILAPGSTRTVFRERLGTRFEVVELSYAGHRIWGATATMMSALLEVINDEKTER